MSDRLNFFLPYQSAPAGHENQLTRALLVVLRYSPLAHQSWLSLVSPGRSLHELPRPQFATQRQRIDVASSDVGEGEEIPGVSVWLAPDATHIEGVMEASDRQQVLDGIITYGTDLVVVVENKIHWNRPTTQPNHINLHGSPVRFEERPRSVQWQEVLGIFSDLVERDLVHGAERLLVLDFLDLVEDHFPRIGPYSTLARCGQHRFRLERRLDALIGSAAGTDRGKALGWRDIEGSKKVFMAGLSLSEDGATVALRMYPADTLGQARAFYGDPASVQAVLDLRSLGWSVQPNFHWGFAASGYAWCSTPLPVDRYCEFWIGRIAETRKLPRAEWDAFWATLIEHGIVADSDRNGFDLEFAASKRQSADPRPGLFCEFSWALPEAVRLDSRGELVAQVRRRINELLDALGAPLLP